MGLCRITRRGWGRRLTAAGLVTIHAVALAALYAPRCIAESVPSEHAVKAAYLYKFLLFTQWPEATVSADARDPITIGILGKDAFGDAFAEVDRRPVGPGNRVLHIVRLGGFRDAHPDLARCRVLFICASERPHLGAILAAVRKAAVLTVSDTERFVDAGGMIGLVMKGRLVRWEINRRAAHDAGVTMSSQLLRSAVRLVDAAQAPDTGGTPLQWHRRPTDQHLAGNRPCSHHEI